jgi:hypothetical protein
MNRLGSEAHRNPDWKMMPEPQQDRNGKITRTQRAQRHLVGYPVHHQELQRGG